MQLEVLPLLKLIVILMLGGFTTLQTLIMLPYIQNLGPSDVKLTIGYGLISAVLIILSIRMIRKL